MQIKKVAYFILTISALLIASYFLQPLKRGTGLNTNRKYALVTEWPQFSNDLKIGNPTGICIDTNQNIVIFHRGKRDWPLLGSMPTTMIQDKTILIVDKGTGKLIDSWGDNLFIMPHGLKVDKENNIWITDCGLNQVFKFTHDGKLIMKLGEANISGNDSLHFDKPTDIAITNDGSFYVSDGYGNSRIVKYSAEGKYLFEWGKKGNNKGEFNIPHSITLDNSGNVYVADRENNRIQVFDQRGKFIKQFADKSFGVMCAIAFDKEKSNLFAVDDFTFLKLKHRGSDVFIFDIGGQVQTRFGRSDYYSGSTSWYHDLTIDKEDNIYVGDILNNRIQKFKLVSAE